MPESIKKPQSRKRDNQLKINRHQQKNNHCIISLIFAFGVVASFYVYYIVSKQKRPGEDLVSFQSLVKRESNIHEIDFDSARLRIDVLRKEIEEGARQLSEAVAHFGSPKFTPPFSLEVKRQQVEAGTKEMLSLLALFDGSTKEHIPPQVKDEAGDATIPTSTQIPKKIFSIPPPLFEESNLDQSSEIQVQQPSRPSFQVIEAASEKTTFDKYDKPQSESRELINSNMEYSKNPILALDDVSFRGTSLDVLMEMYSPNSKVGKYQADSVSDFRKGRRADCDGDFGVSLTNRWRDSAQECCSSARSTQIANNRNVSSRLTCHLIRQTRHAGSGDQLLFGENVQLNFGDLVREDGKIPKTYFREYVKSRQAPPHCFISAHSFHQIYVALFFFFLLLLKPCYNFFFS
jgi:hypothetical protein